MMRCCGPLSTFARGRIDLGKLRRNWEDILRVVASIYSGTVRAYNVVTMLQRDGHPTALGEAIASFSSRFPSWSPGCLRATRVTSSGQLDEDLHLPGDLGILDYQLGNQYRPGCHGV